MIQETQKENKAAEDHERLYQMQMLTLENLILSQESDPGTHLRLREIEMEREIPRASVHRIAKFDLELQNLTKLTIVQRLTREDKKKRIERGKRLLRYMTLANLEKTFANCRHQTINKVAEFMG